MERYELPTVLSFPTTQEAKQIRRRSGIFISVVVIVAIFNRKTFNDMNMHFGGNIKNVALGCD
jgi:hypothetical protein